MVDWNNCVKLGTVHKWVEGQDGYGNPDVYCERCGTIQREGQTAGMEFKPELQGKTVLVTGGDYKGKKGTVSNVGIFSDDIGVNIDGQDVEIKDGEYVLANEHHARIIRAGAIETFTGKCPECGEHYEDSEEDYCDNCGSSFDENDNVSEAWTDDKCPKCKGKGHYIHWDPMYGMTEPDCSECQGTGNVWKDQGSESIPASGTPNGDWLWKHFKWVTSMDQDDIECKQCGFWVAPQLEHGYSNEGEIMSVARNHMKTHRITESYAIEDFNRSSLYNFVKDFFAYGEKVGDDNLDHVSYNWNHTTDDDTISRIREILNRLYGEGYVKKWVDDYGLKWVGRGWTPENPSVEKSGSFESYEELECPECNSSKVHPNRQKGDNRFGQGEYACNNCGATFGGEADRHHDSTIGSSVFDDQPSMNIEDKPKKNYYAHDKTSRDAIEAGLYGYGSATGRMGPAEHWKQGLDSYGDMGYDSKLGSDIFNQFRGMSWSDLPEDIKQVYIAKHGFIDTTQTESALENWKKVADDLLRDEKRKASKKRTGESKVRAVEMSVYDWWDQVTSDGSDVARMYGKDGTEIDRIYGVFSGNQRVEWQDLPNGRKDHYFTIYMEELGADKYGDHMELFPDKFTTEYPQSQATNGFYKWNSFSESKSNESEKDEARLWWDSKPQIERQSINIQHGGTMSDGAKFDWLADGGQFDVTKLFNEQILGKQGISTGWGKDDINTVDLTRRSGLFDNDYYTKDSDGRSHESYASEEYEDIIDKYAELGDAEGLIRELRAHGFSRYEIIQVIKDNGIDPSYLGEGFQQKLYGYVDAKCKTCGVEFDSIPDMDEHYGLNPNHESNINDLDSYIPNSD